MKVLALGCAGGMGSVAVHAAKDYEAVDEIVIADLNEKSAMALAEQIGDKAQAIRLDVTDSEALGAAMENADVVVNSVGPYYRFGVPVLKAAIAAKRHYVDICDDVDVTLDILDWDERARAADGRALIGMGAVGISLKEQGQLLRIVGPLDRAPQKRFQRIGLFLLNEIEVIVHRRTVPGCLEPAGFLEHFDTNLLEHLPDLEMLVQYQSHLSYYCFPNYHFVVP